MLIFQLRCVENLTNNLTQIVTDSLISRFSFRLIPFIDS